MTETQTSLRLPADWIAHADALATRLHGAPELAAGRSSRAAVLRVAISLGLAELERWYPEDDAHLSQKTVEDAGGGGHRRPLRDGKEGASRGTRRPLRGDGEPDA